MSLLNILRLPIRLISLNNAHRLCVLRLSSDLSKSKQDSDEFDKPIPYLQSGASKWKAQYSREGITSDRLWYEPHIVLGSITVFLIYFCILREESDIDQQLNVPLYQRIDGLEEKQLLLTLQYNEDHGLPTKDIKDRLEDIQKK